MPQKPISVRFPDDQAAAVQAFAKRRSITKAEVVRLAVGEMLRKGGQASALHEMEERVNGSLAAINKRLSKLTTLTRQETQLGQKLMLHFVKLYLTNTIEITDPEVLASMIAKAGIRFDRFALDYQKQRREYDDLARDD